MNAIILLILCQIILESFPVSSSGHMLLLEKIFQKFGFAAPNLPENFDYFLHGPTILILMTLFWKDWFYPIKKLLSSSGVQGRLFKIFLKICGFVLVTSIIAVLVHVVIKDHLAKQSWFESTPVLLLGFCVTACWLALLLVKDSKESSYEILNLKKVIIIGLVQGLALFPGISRFASVYSTSRLLNLSPRRAFQFTFLIQFPLIVAGFLLGIFKLTQIPKWIEFFSLNISVAFVVATIVAFFALRFMQNLAQSKKIGRFCFYMLIPILCTLFLGKSFFIFWKK